MGLHQPENHQERTATTTRGWSDSEVDQVWRAVLRYWPNDDVRAALTIMAALSLNITAAETIERVTTAGEAKAEKELIEAGLAAVRAMNGETE